MKTHRLWISCALMVPGLGFAGTFADVQSLAMRGDYQAQRNLAYGYSSAPYSGQEKNALLSCAWRLVIVNSGSPKVDQSDASNQQVYCGSLDKVQLSAATAQARNIFKQVYLTEAPF